MRPTRREILRAGTLGAAGLALPLSLPSAARAATGAAVPLASPLRFGVNGHPYNAAAYNANSSTVPGVPYATQVAMLTAMGMNIYRTDIVSDAAGRALNHAKLLSMHDLLDAAGIECMPMMGDNYSATLTGQQNYDRGYAKAAGFATNYGHMFTHYNLGNEWELFKDLLLRPDGDQSSHYDLQKSALAMQWIKGAHAGLKSVQPTAKTSIAVSGYFPVWWQSYVLDNVDLDFIDWHWYADMQRNIGGLPGDTITNILDFLWDEYGLPIWCSETNDRPSATQTAAYNEQRQVNWYNEWHAACLAHPHCEAMLLYELLDEPMHPAGPTNQEANYGLVKFPNFDSAIPDHTDWAYKSVARRLTGSDHLVGGFEGSGEGWVLGLGPEYPGATGSFTRDGTLSKGGTLAGVLAGNFAGGGNYVQISRAVSLAATALRFWIRSTTVGGVGVRLVDSTGQTHQQRVNIVASGDWQHFTVSDFDSGTNYLHFGGANDGIWHGPATRVGLTLNRSDIQGTGTTGSIRVDEIVLTTPEP